MTIIKIEKKRIPIKQASITVGLDSQAINLWVKSDEIFKDGRIHHLKYDQIMLDSIRAHREKIGQDLSKAAINEGTDFLSMIQNDPNIEI